MKKYVFSLLMCASGLAIQAQVTQFPDGFTSGKTVWIVRAGASLNGVSGDGVDATKDGWEKQKPFLVLSKNISHEVFGIPVLFHIYYIQVLIDVA